MSPAYICCHEEPSRRSQPITSQAAQWTLACLLIKNVHFYLPTYPLGFLWTAQNRLKECKENSNHVVGAGCDSSRPF